MSTTSEAIEDDSLFSDEISTTSVSLNQTISPTDDRESLALLRQIFPDEPLEELRKLHQDRLGAIREHRNSEQEVYHVSPSNDPPRDDIKENIVKFPSFPLPDDFLRLPLNVAVLRLVRDTKNAHHYAFRYQSLANLENTVMEELRVNGFDEYHERSRIFTRAVFRDSKMGLGMTLEYKNGHVCVVSVSIKQHSSYHNQDNQDHSNPTPAKKAGIRPGDVILGFNGHSLVNYWNRPAENLLSHVGQVLRHSPDPVVIHFRRIPSHLEPVSQASLLDDTILDSSIDDIAETALPQQRTTSQQYHLWSTPSFGNNGEPQIHFLIQLLSSQGLVPSKQEEIDLTAALAQFNYRAWEMETFASLRLSQRGGLGVQDTLIPLVGVRRAITVRIVNYFTEGSREAYTIWVYDVESGKEWYAPLRYFQDFYDLRVAVTNLIPALAKLPFPKHSKPLFALSPRAKSTAELETQCWQLEKFIRCLCSILYESQLNASIGEVVIHVQSFLGCDNLDLEGSPSHPRPTGTLLQESHNNTVDIKAILKRSIQCYTYRAFLLRPLALMVDDFVENMRQKSPSLQDQETMESQETFQNMALEDLATVEKFLDFLQTTILNGCKNDFRSITMHQTFELLRQNGFLQGKKGEIAWTELVREAVREQVEVEAYVPLRSVVSKWLVHGWRHEDMEIHWKIRELRKRPISFFNVPPRDGWINAWNILKVNVEQSTLPCMKLKAIVEAAQEIGRISQDMLGADQFLPILIYCVVMADLDRPCALCVLLRALCDKMTKIGQVGYYLASFEAAVMHVCDFDLSQPTENMKSFVSVKI